MNTVILAVFPGLLFSVQPPVRTQSEKPVLAPVVREYRVQPSDSCHTYIYALQGNTTTIYYNGEPLSPELLHKLGPLAAPLRYGLSLENVG
ncbi:hypothetical protein BH09BAC1_BH09BAC1_19470 [soil metagenome]